MLSRKELDQMVKNVYMNNTLLVHQLVTEKVPRERTIESNIKKDVKVKLYITSKEEMEWIQVTEEDISIQNAFYTFLKYHISEVTLEQLVGLMCGNFFRRVTSEKIIHIKQRVEFLANLGIRIDASMLCNWYPRLRTANLEKERKMIDISIATKNGKNGKITTVYRINSIPVMHYYAECLNQIIALDRDSLKCVRMNLSQEREEILFELLQKFCVHANPKSTLYEKKIPITLFAWDKNRKKYIGIVGKRMKELDKRRGNTMLSFIYEIIKMLDAEGLLPEYEIVEKSQVYFNQYYKMVQIKITNKRRNKKCTKKQIITKEK